MAALLKGLSTRTTLSVPHPPSSHNHLQAKIGLNTNTLPIINGHELALE